jgi:hypothetical protein
MKTGRETAPLYKVTAVNHTKNLKCSPLYTNPHVGGVIRDETQYNA